MTKEEVLKRTAENQLKYEKEKALRISNGIINLKETIDSSLLKLTSLPFRYYFRYS